MDTSALFQEAQDSNISIMYLSLSENGSMCIQSESMRYYIGMDYGVLKNESSKRVHLAHELGHCKTGAFYNRWAARDIRQKHEHRADKWAIKKLVPKDELLKAIDSGHINIWDWAEYFNVTEDFMKKAVRWYTYGNLAVE